MGTGAVAMGIRVRERRDSGGVEDDRGEGRQTVKKAGGRKKSNGRDDEEER